MCLSKGSVTVRYGHSAPTRAVRIREASHPVPDAAGVEATRAIVELLEEADTDDLVVCVISGGGSALLTLPADDITLEDLQQTTDALLRSGASINEINVVRKHLDSVKGGGLARLAAPAQVITLVLSDVVGNPLDAIASGPTVPDTSTWAEAAAVLDRYGLWDRVPASVTQRLRAGLAGACPRRPSRATPSSSTPTPSSSAATWSPVKPRLRRPSEMGLRSLVLTTFVEGEARGGPRPGRRAARSGCQCASAGAAVLHRGWRRNHRDGARPGSRGAEPGVVPLGGARLARPEDVLLASIGTDGNDGPTDAAGAFVDGTTLDRAAALGLDPAAYLANNDSYTFFDRLGDLIRTGPTNTNVNDLYLLFAF